MLVWQANAEVIELVESVKQKHHLPHLQEARIATCFSDSKAFVKGRFNWGKTAKFSNLAKLWHHTPHDFLIQLPGDAWHGLLDAHQREAFIDLRISCCNVEYVPEMVAENGIKKPLVDEWGRVQYTNEIKMDEDGMPKWRVVSLDLQIFSENVARYGLWCEDMTLFNDAIKKASEA